MKNALDLNQVATLSTVLISNLDENVFFSKISEFVMNTFGEYKVLAFEAFQDGATELRAENGKIVENGLSYEKGQGLSGYVVRMKRAYYSNSQRDPLLSTSKRDDCVVSELSVPVTCDGTVIGTIHVQSSNEDRKFSEEDVTIITNLLNELDAVVRNMKMYLIAKNLNKQLLETIEAKNLELSTRGPELKSSINKSSKIDIIGRSNSMVEVLNIAKSVAKEDFPVFIQGPSGTGKKLLAKQIHSLSERAGVECSTVHCSAIQDSQLEVELFGIGERAGLLERSNGGTILLDSVDELSLNIQGKLLRAIFG